MKVKRLTTILTSALLSVSMCCNSMIAFADETDTVTETKAQDDTEPAEIQDDSDIAAETEDGTESAVDTETQGKSESSTESEETYVIETTVESSERKGTQIPVFITFPSDYDEKASYPLVIMLHGHADNHNEFGGFDEIAYGLAENGIITAMLDFPGCGDSTESFQLNTQSNMKADILDVLNFMIDSYSVDEERIGSFGYSMGGRLIMELIAEDLFDFSAIELVAPAADTEDLKEAFGGTDAWDEMKSEAEEFGYASFNPSQSDQSTADIQELSLEWFTDLEAYDDLPQQTADKYDGNSLVIWEVDDPIVSPSVSKTVAEALSSAVINTYTDGHYYSFRGSDDTYTNHIVNDSSVNFFVNELFSEQETSDDNDTNEEDAESRIDGYVSYVDKYGNLALTISEQDLADSGYVYGDMLNITVGETEWTLPYCTAYEEVDYGSPLLYGNNGTLKIAMNTKSFAEQENIAYINVREDSEDEYEYVYRVDAPVAVSISMSEKGGYLEDLTMRQLVLSNDRDDYPELSDEEFANFRVIETTGMGENCLYRSSSPLSAKLNRNTYASKAAENAEIKTIVNLADSYAAAIDYSDYYASYYSEQDFVCLNLGVDYTDESFEIKLLDGLRFMIAHDGPYLIHCSEGKDRAGFVSALLECFMGAAYDEVVVDYMLSYENLYGIEKDSEQYEYLADTSIVQFLKYIFKTDYPEEDDLAEDAQNYFLSIGLTEDDLDALYARLATDF